MPMGADGKYIPLERLSAFAANAARCSFPRGRTGGAGERRAVARALARLRRERETAKAGGGAAAEWLLDNAYLIEREGLAAAEGFRSAPRLRAVRGGALVAYAAAALVRAGRGEVTAERLEAFLAGFQSVLPLERAELTRFADAVRAALVRFAAANARDAGCLSAAVTSLRALSTLDLGPALERADLTDAILRRDPAGVYPRMDERTRGMYLAEITRLAKKQRSGEQKLARRILALSEGSSGEARHVGWWLFGREQPSPLPAAAYLAANAALTAAVSAAVGVFARSLTAAALALLPASGLAKGFTDAAVLRCSRPRLIPRMELDGCAGEEGRTVCAVSALLTQEGSGPALAARLEEYRCAARGCGGRVVFALLADLPEAETAETPEDAPRIAAARGAFDALNEKYGGGFLLLCRRRS